MKCRDGLHCVCATDRLHSCFRQTEVLNLSFLNQIFNRSCYVFDWNVRIDAMLIEEIDRFSLESLQRCLGNFLNMLRTAIRVPPIWTPLDEVETEFGRDHHLFSHGSERFADEFFVRERPVHFGGVKNVTPRSTAARSSEIISCLSAAGP